MLALPGLRTMIWGALFFGCVLLEACGGPSTPASPSQTSPTGSLQGVVFHETVPCFRCFTPNVAPAFATVTIIAAGKGVSSATTDSQGKYSLQVPTGSFHVVYSAAGYQSNQTPDRTISAGEQIKMPDVTLKTSAWTLTGVTIDTHGTPVPGVKVAVD